MIASAFALEIGIDALNKEHQAFSNIGGLLGSPLQAVNCNSGLHRTLPGRDFSYHTVQKTS